MNVYVVLWLAPLFSGQTERVWKVSNVFASEVIAKEFVERRANLGKEVRWVEHNAHGLSWECPQIEDYFILEEKVVEDIGGDFGRRAKMSYDEAWRQILHPTSTGVAHLCFNLDATFTVFRHTDDKKCVYCETQGNCRHRQPGDVKPMQTVPYPLS